MIISVTIERQDEFSIVDGERAMAQLNALLGLIAAAYSDDPGTSDLDDEQPAHSVTGLTLGDVRLARRLTR